MTDIEKSEAHSDLSDLISKYKKFCFESASLLKYDQVPNWMALADGRVEEAFREKRSIMQSIKDYYVLYVASMALGILSFWYLWLFYGFIFIGLVGVLSALTVPVFLIGAVFVILILLVLAPLFVLVSAGIYHLIAKLLGGKGSYAETLSIFVNVSAAQTILMIPVYIAYATIIGLVLSPLAYVIVFYGLYLKYSATKYLHGLSTKRSIAAIVLFYGAGIALFIGLYFLMVLFVLGSRLAAG